MGIHGSSKTTQSLAATIQAKLSTLPQCSPNRCIYKVPKLLRRIKLEAYTPVLVSIGPLHYKNKKLLPMEVHKLKYLQSFLHASQTNGDLNSYLQIVQDNKDKIRDHYADPITYLSNEEFIEMVLIDSVFLIEVFRREFDPSLREDDQIWGRPCKIKDVYRDIRLVENQLPFFIIKHLYRTAFKESHANRNAPSFTDIACKFLGVNKSRIDNIDPLTNEANSCHLLDLLRSHYLPSPQGMMGDVEKDERNLVCPRAINLYEAGINFHVANTNDLSKTLCIHFDNEKGILTIPKLIVEDKTDSMFRNLLALEQCHYPYDTYLSDYYFFLNCLINTPDDVHLLAKAGIIENWLGSEKDVSDLFNSLCENVYKITGLYYYLGVTDQLISYCNKRWNRYKATLKHTHFRHPWAVVSVIYAIILLVLTVIQVVVSIVTLPNVKLGSSHQ